MSKITITDLEVSFHVGVPDEERAQPQRLLVTVAMTHDFSSAAATDSITKTIDYYAVSQKIIALGKDRSWKLIEKLAHDIADLVLEEFHPDTVSVTVKKFILPQTAHVSVSLTKQRTNKSSVKPADSEIP